MPNRYREDNSITQPNYDRTSVSYGGSTRTVSSHKGTAGVWREMYDVVTPRFAERRNKGELIFSPMTKSKQVFGLEYSGHTNVCTYWSPPPPEYPVRDDWGSLIAWKLAPLIYGKHDSFPWMMLEDVELSDTKTRAATAALASWKEASVQSYVLLAELQKTLNTLKNPLQAIAQAIEHGKRKGFTLKGGLNGVSGQYLAWFYGIRTIMFDIEGTIEALHKRAVERYTARGTDKVTWTEVSPNLELHKSSLMDARYQVTKTDTYEVRAGLLGQFEASVVETFGLRLSDIPSSVWELVPWSFVADWFFNLGDYIQALTVDSADGVKGQWITTIRTGYYERKVTSVNLTNSPGSTWTISRLSTDKDYGLYMTTTREPTNLASQTGIRLRSNLDRIPIAAALALVTQNFTRR